MDISTIDEQAKGKKRRRNKIDKIYNWTKRLCRSRRAATSKESRREGIFSEKHFEAEEGYHSVGIDIHYVGVQKYINFYFRIKRSLNIISLKGNKGSL